MHGHSGHCLLPLIGGLMRDDATYLTPSMVSSRKKSIFSWMLLAFCIHVHYKNVPPTGDY